MSLVYLVTRLPKLRLGEPAPLARAELISQARAALEGEDLAELKRTVLLEEVEETVRSLHRAQTTLDNPSPTEVASFVRNERQRTALDLAAGELPQWVIEPLPQHVLLRRYWQHLIVETHSERLRSYAQARVNIEEALTALRMQREKLPRSAFSEQMSAHFDSSARVIMSNFAQADFGIGQRFAWWPRLVTALDLGDRVEGERALNRLRFNAIDTLEATATFSVEAVLAAYFRLRIIEREASWDRDEGLATLERVLTIGALEEAIGTAT